ncbi:MAG: peptidoglycan-associated lipoprotein Pal [Acidobacteria bacterium]|nr:peptidoglycan-associated lipoprotein Pal [Acidobacteriota bacterium]
MRRSTTTLVSLAFIIAALLISGIGCAKKVAPPPPPPKEEPPPPPPPKPEIPAPTISLSVSPAAIEKGSSTTLSWNSSNATSVVIDNGVGTVEPSGRRTVRPSASTTYAAKATGPGGTANAEARVTVTEPPPPPPKPVSDSEFFKANIRDAFFDFDKYDIRDDARAALTSNIRALKERPSIRITIEGHCDERGSSKYNLALGDRRANAAKEFLVNQGIEAGRIDTVSYGEERQFCTEKSEECYQQNRRAHFLMR